MYAVHVEVGNITFARVDKALGARQRKGPMGGVWGPHVIHASGSACKVQWGA